MCFFCVCEKFEKKQGIVGVVVGERNAMADEAKNSDIEIPSAEPISEKIDSIIIEASAMAYEPPSPLTGCYILIILGEPHSDEHKDIILQRLLKGNSIFFAFDKCQFVTSCKVIGVENGDILKVEKLFLQHFSPFQYIFLFCQSL